MLIGLNPGVFDTVYTVLCAEAAVVVVFDSISAVLEWNY